MIVEVRDESIFEGRQTLPQTFEVSIKWLVKAGSGCSLEKQDMTAGEGATKWLHQTNMLF